MEVDERWGLTYAIYPSFAHLCLGPNLKHKPGRRDSGSINALEKQMVSLNLSKEDFREKQITSEPGNLFFTGDERYAGLGRVAKAESFPY
jgi:hypothetical protein